jgi:hypothetical protein
MLPANDTVFTVGANSTYLYNEVPRSVQTQVDRWRLVGVDAKVHAAKEIMLRFNLAVMYERTASKTVVDSAIDLAIATHLGRVGLGGVVQVSDVENVVHNVAGVDNVRFLNSGDYTDWDYAQRNSFQVGIQRIVDGSVAQTYISTAGRPTDIVYGDAEVPVFESAYKSTKAQNTFRAG